MFFSKAFFVLSFAALALAASVPVGDPLQLANAGTFCLGARPFGTSLIRPI